MTDVVYAIREYGAEQQDLSLMEVKIGYSSDLEGRIRTFQSFTRNLELLNAWEVNQDKEIRAFEQGIHEIAEQFAYRREDENFVFLDEQYQEFADAVNKIAEPVDRESLKQEPQEDSAEPENYIGTTPRKLYFDGEEYEVSTWRETLQKAAKHAIQSSDKPDKILEIQGASRQWFAKDENRDKLYASKNIPETRFSFEGQRNADQIHRTLGLIAEKFNIDSSEIRVELE
jgi:hypothetical protein